MTRPSRGMLLALAFGLVATGGALVAQAPVPEIAFESNADFLRTPPDTFVGEVGGVGANSRGQIFVYTRTGHPYATLGDNRTFYRGGSRLFQFDPTGKFVRELGQDVYGFNAAIGLRVDPQDNVWTIDAGANQVVKFDPNGQVALVLGRKPETMSVRPATPPAGGGPVGGGPGGPGGGGQGGAAAANRRPGEGTPGSTFFRPSDVAWDSAGNIYVADGMGANNRIAKFDKEGRFIRQWGATGSQPGEFRGVKALAIDARGNVYAADYGNRRIQVFDADGQVKNQFGNIGTPLAMCITIDVEVRREGRALVIRIEDDGVGIADGTPEGLGMSIISTLVESELGGRVSVQGIPGQGTRVEISAQAQGPVG